MHIKPRLSKKCIGFIVIFALLIATSLVQAECPVCQGSGSVSDAPGMENVQITLVESKGQYITGEAASVLFLVPMDEMLGYSGALYRYDVKLSVVNDSPDDIEGYVKFVLAYLSDGSVISTDYEKLKVAGETSLDVTYTICFESEEQVFLLKTEVYAEAAIEDVPDVTCNETGKIPLNSWLLVNGFKDSFLELGGEGVQYKTGMVFD